MKNKATRNHKGCGLCKPYKRSGNGAERYTAKENAKRRSPEAELEDYGEPCTMWETDCRECGEMSCFEYSDQYDTHYCLNCGGAFEKKCSDPHCEFCVGRLEKWLKKTK